MAINIGFSDQIYPDTSVSEIMRGTKDIPMYQIIRESPPVGFIVLGLLNKNEIFEYLLRYEIL